MNRLKNLLIMRYNVILIVYWMLLCTLIFIPVYGKTTTVIWQDNFDDGSLDDWLITGRHYIVSTDTYTKWNGSASAASGKLAFVSEHHWEDWSNDRIMNITLCRYQKPATFGQWSFEVFPAENNFIGITFLEHFPDPNTPEENPLTYDITFRYALYILTAPYEAGKPGAAFVHGDFVSPTGVTVKDFTGEPCFIFIKEGTDIPYTVYAIKEFPTDIPTTDTLTIHITRDNSSKFTFFVNNNVLFSGKDTSPPSTSLDAEGYYSGLCSFGGGSWIDNINVSDTITVTEEKKASEPGIIPIVIGLGILIIIRKKRKS